MAFLHADAELGQFVGDGADAVCLFDAQAGESGDVRRAVGKGGDDGQCLCGVRDGFHVSLNPAQPVGPVSVIESPRVTGQPMRSRTSKKRMSP